MHPGWYPDPFSDGMLRWWDGTTWTGKTVPNNPTPWAFRLDPRADLEAELQAGRRASIAVVVAAAMSAVSSVAGVVVLGPALRDLGRHLGDPSYRPDFMTARFAVFQVWGIGTFVLQILFMLWLYRAATLARRASIPSRRDPVWAFAGYFVPVVNFWFPYQVAAGCFPPGDPLRRTAARWWAWSLAQVFLGVAVVIAMFSSQAVALAICVGAILATAMCAREARVMIAAIANGHTGLLEYAA